MSDEFQQAVRAGDLEALRKVPKADLHKHGWAGADPEAVAAILGKPCAVLNRRLRSMEEMHQWARDHLGNPDPELRRNCSRPRLSVRPTTESCGSNSAMTCGR